MKRFLSAAYDNAWALMIGATVLWGLNGVVSRVAAGQASPMSLVFLRWLAVCLLLGVFLGRQLRDHRSAIFADGWRIFLMGAFGFTGFTVLFYTAGAYTTAVNLTLLQSAIPPLVFLGSVVFFRETPTLMQIMGMSVMLVGVILVATHGEPQKILAFRLNFGDALVLVGCVFYAGFTLALRSKPTLPPLAFFAALAFAALLSALPFMVLEIVVGAFYWPTKLGWALMIFVALGPSLAAQLFFMRSVALVGPNRAGLFSNLVPIFGALFAVLLLGEDFHFYHLAALLLALAGIGLAEMRR